MTTPNTSSRAGEIEARWSEATYLACLHDGGPGGRLCDECRDMAVVAPYDVAFLLAEVRRLRGGMMDMITAAVEEGYMQGAHHPKGVSIIKRRREVTLAFLQRLAAPAEKGDLRGDYEDGDYCATCGCLIHVDGMIARSTSDPSRCVECADTDDPARATPGAK